jgi:hypothetical protein
VAPFTVNAVSCRGAPLAVSALHNASAAEMMSADRRYTVIAQVEDDGRRHNLKLEISSLSMSQLRFATVTIKCCVSARTFVRTYVPNDVLIRGLFKFVQTTPLDL